MLVYLDAGVETKAFNNAGVSGAPFMKEDQLGTCVGRLGSILLTCPFTYPGQKYAEVSRRFLAMQASTIRCRMFPAA